MQLPQAPKDAFEPIWCAWGYGRDFTPEQVFETLPVAKRLGFRWASLDDGWQVAEGDWTPVATKFPNGDADMKALVDRIHAAGMKAQLWWSPLGADPWLAHRPRAPRLAAAQRGWLAAKITWWDDNYLCPALGPVREDAAAFVEKSARRVGIRRPQDRRPAPERRAALLQHGPRPRGAGRRRRRRPGILQGDLGCGASHEAGRAGRDLPVRHRATRSSRCPISTCWSPPTRRAPGRFASRARR